MEKSTETIEAILEAYQQADDDATEILSYINSISKPVELKESSLPSLVKNLENKESDVTKKYMSYASIVGGTVAAAVGTSVTTGMFSSGLATGGTMAVGGLGLGMITGLNILSIPALALPLALKMLRNAKVKRYQKDNQESMRQKKKKLEEGKKKLTIWVSNLQQRVTELDEIMHKDMSNKFTEYKEKTKKFAQDISIQIDDFLNVDVNKRILKYNEVILKQYKLQKDLEEKVDFLFDAYNKMYAKKQELERQINCLVKLLNAINCPASVINKALNEET